MNVSACVHVRICDNRFVVITHKAFTFFATHFMELTNLETLYPNVEKLSVLNITLTLNTSCICSFHFEVKVITILY